MVAISKKVFNTDDRALVLGVLLSHHDQEADFGLSHLVALRVVPNNFYRDIFFLGMIITLEYRPKGAPPYHIHELVSPLSHVPLSPLKATYHLHR